MCACYSWLPHTCVEQVLKAMLPQHLDIPSSYECVGHLAHLNLREEFTPFKHLIGQIILDVFSSLSLFLLCIHETFFLLSFVEKSTYQDGGE